MQEQLWVTKNISAQHVCGLRCWDRGCGARESARSKLSHWPASPCNTCSLGTTCSVSREPKKLSPSFCYHLTREGTIAENSLLRFAVCVLFPQSLTPTPPQMKCKEYPVSRWIKYAREKQVGLDSGLEDSAAAPLQSGSLSDVTSSSKCLSKQRGHKGKRQDAESTIGNTQVCRHHAGTSSLAAVCLQIV